MAYEKQTWHDLPATDTPINATRMSHIEQGIYDAWEHGGGESAPIGAIMGYGGTTAPDGWLICDGSAVSRTTYADLFSVIGVAYGGGDGSTTFNIPDYRGMNIVGLKSTDTDFNAIGKTGGEKTHTLTVNEMPVHSHAIATQEEGTGQWWTVKTFNEERQAANYSYSTSYAGGNQAHNNMSPYTVSNVIIKALDTTPTQATVVNQNSNSTTDSYSCDYVNKLNTYSTTEKIIGTYCDGKPLYQKTINGTVSDSGELASNVDTLVKVYGSGSHTGSSIWRTIPYYEYWNGYNFLLTANKMRNSSSVLLSSIMEDNNVSADLNMTLEYTKTTDQAV